MDTLSPESPAIQRQHTPQTSISFVRALAYPFIRGAWANLLMLGAWSFGYLLFGFFALIILYGGYRDFFVECPQHAFITSLDNKSPFSLIVGKSGFKSSLTNDLERIPCKKLHSYCCTRPEDAQLKANLVEAEKGEARRSRKKSRMLAAALKKDPVKAWLNVGEPFRTGCVLLLVFFLFGIVPYLLGYGRRLILFITDQRNIPPELIKVDPSIDSFFDSTLWIDGLKLTFWLLALAAVVFGIHSGLSNPIVESLTLHESPQSVLKQILVTILICVLMSPLIVCIANHLREADKWHCSYKHGLFVSLLIAAVWMFYAAAGVFFVWQFPLLWLCLPLPCFVAASITCFHLIGQLFLVCHQSEIQS